MASNDLVECGVCSEVFNEEEHKPILLPCSHSFCVRCVDVIIQNRVQLCPVCRKKFHASSSKDLPINRGLLDVARYFSQLETRQSKHSVPYKGWRESHKDSVAKIPETKKEVEKLIQMDEKMIDEVQNINRELKAMVEDNEKLVKKFKNHKEKLQNYMTDVEEKEKVIKQTQVKLEATTNFTTAGPFMDEMSIAMEALQGTLSKMKPVMEANQTLLANGRKKHKMSQKKLSCIKEILDSADDEEDGSLTCFPVAGAVGKNREDLICLTVEEFWEAKGDVYVFKTGNGVRRFSKVVRAGMNNRTLYIPSLKEKQNIPPNAQFFRYDSLMKICRLRTYMDLSARGKSLGRIIITYVNENYYQDYVINHRCLCSGELGPSFANSNVLELKNFGEKEESIVFGDYEWNDGTGGKPVCGSRWAVPTVNSGYLQCPSYAIFPHTYEEKTASQFCIKTRENYSYCFGYISEGIDILQSVAQKFVNIREVKISACGVVMN